MAIQFRVVEPREDILARLEDELRMANAATSKQVRKSHRDRAEAYRVSLEIVDCYFRSAQPTTVSEPEFVGIRHLHEIRDEIRGGGIVRG